MIIVGLTGGIGCGKSEVCRMLGELGARIIDADTMAKQISETNEQVKAELKACFGNDIYLADGKLDRAKLGRIIFSDETARLRINQIVHPYVIKEIDKEIERCRRLGQWPVVVVEAALIYEAGVADKFDYVVVVSAPAETVMERLSKRDRLSRQEIRDRIQSQLPLEIKEKKAHYVLRNEGDLSELREKVAQLYRWLVSKHKEDL
ncbi:MAG: dephospho-CoA kinase [candidate division KSB1 bacterium]|nr:dephospho-CoA kinase [candidate division KSB1 bacterium]